MKDTCKVDIIYAQDSPREMEGVRQLLAANKLALDPGVELFVVCRHQGRVVACAGLDHKTIKCVAIDEKFGGDSLDLRLATEVRRLATEHRAFPLFLYSAPHTLEFFAVGAFIHSSRRPNWSSSWSRVPTPSKLIATNCVSSAGQEKKSAGWC